MAPVINTVGNCRCVFTLYICSYVPYNDKEVGSVFCVLKVVIKGPKIPRGKMVSKSDVDN